MEIPFYTSFKEFKDNYETDLEKWLSIYPDGDEMDYLGYVYERYSDYAVTDISGITIDEPYYKDKTVWVEVKPNNVPKYYWNLQGQYCADEEGSVFERLSFTRVFEIINNRFREIDKYYIENYSNSYKFFHHNVKQIYDEPYHNYNSAGRNDDYIITKKIETDLGECIEFIDLDISGYDIPSGMFNVEIDIIYINDTKYNNFKLSVPKIYKFISDRRKEINGVQTTDEVTSTAEEQHKTGEEHEKITINGSIQLIGYIFTELIEKGYIEPKRKSGKTNASATAEMLLNHFNFTYNANGEQPSKEYLKKALFEQNQLSSDKATFIKIPHLKKLID
ncbi:hypothetical protein [Riemerella anatipestifer]|uniref:hypothetical protein n=1 Tax=Riemerella anatipestifer TaxID=34085 RepID=UPI0004DC3AE0|nr:hypothetical protein [Riemerella anatipestifer]AIH01283.1 hypothetical protein M949_0112 [Riemerella anatipestifer CH3]MCU7541920.1 hypothetical protein [Riemerella anatipestifer]MCW0512507.1 hypothetical protein [Riemerella anatipestifer]QDE19100.1 hypothetical protein FIP52_01035 [Riemerella anatipestifer]